MKTILSIVFRLFTLTILCMSLITCETLTTSEDPDTEQPSKITTQEQANSAAFFIRFRVLDAAPYYSTNTWNNTVKKGSIGGEALVNGSFSYKTDPYNQFKSTSTYNNVAVKLTNYQIEDDYPALTGTATINGTETCISSYNVNIGNTYTGSWLLQGTVTLSGRFIGTVSFSLELSRKGANWTGTLTADGKSFSVTH